MHILYADESGNPLDKSQRHFILAGVSVFERQTHWIAKSLDSIAARFNPADPHDVELHGSPMLKGRGRIWGRLPTDVRVQTIKDALGVLMNSHSSTRIFAMVVDTEKAGEPPVQYAFLQLASRFDRYLQRLDQRGDKQQGMILFDKSGHEYAIQSLTSLYRNKGHRWGKISVICPRYPLLLIRGRPVLFSWRIWLLMRSGGRLIRAIIALPILLCRALTMMARECTACASSRRPKGNDRRVFVLSPMR